MRRLNTDQFTWSRASSSFVAEASELFGRRRLPNEFELVSARTGRAVKFIGSHVIRGGNGDDVIAHVYRNEGSSFEAHVLND